MRLFGLGGARVAGVSAMILVSLFCAVFAPGARAQSAKPRAAVYIKGNPEGRDMLRAAVNNFLVKSGRFQMIAVDAIDVVAKEHVRQMGGAVSDEQIARMGEDAGAQYVCVVERVESDGASYVITSMVNVQSKIAENSDMKELVKGEKVIAVIQSQITAMLEVAGESMAAAAVSEDAAPAPATPATQKPQKSPPPQDYKNFTAGTRFSTFGLNWLIPGYGSFTKMHDYVGGTVQVVLAGVGYFLVISSAFVEYPNMEDYYGGGSGYDPWGGGYGGYDEGAYWDDVDKAEATVMTDVILGGTMLLSSFVFNIVRSFTYDRPSAKTAAGPSDGLMTAVIPTQNGGLKTVVCYSRSF